MAIVVVQVGQCGNQLGDELFTQLAISVASARESNPYADSPFFCNDGMARCVLVDSEPKVVQGVHARHDTFIRAENVVCGQSGRGNNWGMGFYGVKEAEESSSSGVERRRGQSGGAPRRGSASQPQPGFQKVYKAQRAEDGKLLTKALQAIHRETRRTAECAEGFEAILLLHSLVGGTGSGLASRLAEKIRFYFTEPPLGEAVDERREASSMVRDGLDGMLVEKRRARYLVNIAVAPQACGELALQGINAALTLYTMHKYADATILLRNDDVMSPSGAISRSTTKTTNIIQRCLTFKEANEVLVALLMPVLRYGVVLPDGGTGGAGTGRRGHTARGGSRSGRSSTAAAAGGARGVIATIVRNCAPAGDFGRVLRMTGGNAILTLLPTPQNTYEGYKRSVLRCVFYTIAGGKAFLPGCSASLPLTAMWARAALADMQSRGDAQAGHGVGGSRSPNAATQRSAQVRLSQAGREGAARGRPGARRRDGDAERPAWDSSAADASPTPLDREVWDEGQFLDKNHDEDRDAVGHQEEEEGSVYSEVGVTMPPRLLAYYQEVRRSPVSSLSTSLEGVAVLNQAKELNRSLMFPLLRSAALKVSVGAFLYTYEKTGVSSEFIVKAYRHVAEALSLAEDL